MFFFPFSLIFSYLLSAFAHLMSYSNNISELIQLHKLTAHKMTTFCGVTPFIAMTDQTGF